MSYASKISVLKNKITVYENQLVKTQSSLASLRLFLNVASGSSSDYHSCMSAKKNILSDAAELKENCRSAQKYLAGFSQRLNGAAALSINVGYPLFIASIRSKIISYESQITSLNNSISSCERQIESLEAEIMNEERSTYC